MSHCTVTEVFSPKPCVLPGFLWFLPAEERFDIQPKWAGGWVYVRARSCVYVRACVVVGADACILLIMIADVCQCSSLGMFVCLPLFTTLSLLLNLVNKESGSEFQVLS